VNSNANQDARNSPVKEEPQPEGPLLRRKIQYVPVMRTINTYGGRDLEVIEREYQQSHFQRPMKKMEDFGVVDVEALILQLRSRLKLEVTTALGLLYHLAFIRGGDRGSSGLQLSFCDDLTDELLDLLEETAFANSPDVDDPEDARIDSKLVTNRDLVRTLHDEGNELFAGVKADQKFGYISPMHQPWEVVVMIVTILSSVASADDNPQFLGSRPRLLDIMTRVCMVRPIANRGDKPEPSSTVLQLRHILRIRKDVTSMVSTIAPFTRLDAAPPRATRRLFLLLAGTMMDSEECISPSTLGRTPSGLMDLTLDAFTQIAHPDINRKAISAEVPWEQLWSLMLMLARIIPLTDGDIQHLVTGPWMSFVFKAALAIYSLAVVAPLPMRHKMKASPSLRGALVRFLCVGTTMNSTQNNLYRSLSIETRTSVEEYWKRIGETLKVIDAEEDPLASTSSGAGGVIGYGIGGSYDQHLGAKPPARGTGMFGGARQELLWSVMSTSAAGNDVQAFEEWDYMLRVDSSMASRV
jgi:SWI/SNF chromatin-remodeling complex subunit SWI1